MLSVLSVLKLNTPVNFFSLGQKRLFLVWFIVAFGLANHEIILKPMQPLHFTRGYIWTSLFILGVPALHYLLNKLAGSISRKIILGFFVLLFFSDNLTWIFSQLISKATTPSTSYLSREQKEILTILNEQTTNRSLIIGTDELIPYMSTVYTKAYPWLSHPFTTPYVAKKRSAISNFIASGETDPTWKGRELVFVINRMDSLAVKRTDSLSFPVTVLAKTASYVILKGVAR
jgi:hypothetical protein